MGHALRKSGLALSVLVFSAILAIGCMAGCSQSGGSASQPVTITYSTWQTNLTPYLQERVAAFEAENPDINVELKTYDNSQSSFADYFSDLNSASASDLPDVFMMSPTYFNQYQESGELLDLTSYISKSDTVDMSVYPTALTSMFAVGGKTYGLLVDYDTIGLWYNKALFDQAGLDYPNQSWTWDDMTAAAAKIDALGDDTYGIIACNEDQLGYMNTVAACGGYICKDGVFGFSDPATQQGIQYWVDLTAYSPTLSQIEESGGPHVLFMQGKVGMVYGGDWEAADFTSSSSIVGDIINVADLPIMPNGQRGSIINGVANVVSANSQHKDAAFKFLEFLSNDESYQKLGETGTVIPANTYYSDLFYNKYSQYDMGAFARAAANYAYPYATSSKKDWASIVKAEMKDVISGNVSVADGCNVLSSELN